MLTKDDDWMKRYLILTILFCLYLLPIYGTYYNSNTNNYNRYNGISNQQTIETRRIGYSTNYGHGFNKVTQTAPTYRGTTFGSTSYYSGTYRGTYTPTYGGTTYGNSGSGRPGGGPRRSPQRPFSGGTLEDWLDWARMNGIWPVGDDNWPSYVDSDYWDQFLSDYPEYEEYVREWFKAHPDSPNDPFATPVGDCPYWMLFAFIGAYVIYKYNSLIVKQQIC